MRHTPSSKPFTIRRQGDLPPLVVPLPTITLTPQDVRESRTQAEAELLTGRQEWYEHQARQLKPELLAQSVTRFAKQFLNECTRALTQAALDRTESITGCILNPIAAQGWKYAIYRGPDQVSASAPDLSMNVFEHQTRILAAEVIHHALSQKGFRCELHRNPATGPDCFVDEIRVKIFT